jgi:hypothetical protein
MSLMALQAAVITELATLLPTIPIKYENTTQDLSGSPIHLQVINEEVRSSRIRLGQKQGSKRRAGRCAIIVVGQLGAGDGAVKNTASTIRKHFESRSIAGAHIDSINIYGIGATTEGYIQTVSMDWWSYYD